MKKALAVLLSVLAIFSMFSVMAFAEDSTADPTPITVKFMDGDSLIKEIAVKEGDVLTAYAPENPTKPDTETTRYTFAGWQAYDETGAVIDDSLYQKSTLPAPYLAEGQTTATIIYKAVYSEKNIEGRQTFWNFIESIFARFNLLFEYFAEIFGF